MSVPTPSCGALTDTLSVLLGKEMTARDGVMRTPQGDDLVAEYRRANGTLGALLSIDKPTAIHSSSAFLTSVRLHSANLSNANLTGANLVGVIRDYEPPGP